MQGELNIVTTFSTTNHERRLKSVEALRAWAALLIVIYHMVMLTKMQVPQYLHVIEVHFGHGVPLFYTLSGFVLAYGYIDKLNSHAQVIRFYIKRYFRIAPLFYTMMAVWLIVSYFKWGSFRSTFHDIVINATMLFGLVPKTHESIVWAGWSIGVEMLFYLLFPIITVLANNLRAGILALAISLLVSSSFFSIAKSMNIGSYAYMNIITHLPFFLSGVLSYHIWKETGFVQNCKLGLLLFLGTCVSILFIVYKPSVNQLLISIKGVRLDLYVWSFVFILLILSLCIWPIKLMVNRITTGIGRVSFSFYLIHPLVIILLIDVYTKIGLKLGNSLWNFLACAALTITCVSLLAHISFRFIEEPGIKYGKQMADDY